MAKSHLLKLNSKNKTSIETAIFVIILLVLAISFLRANISGFTTFGLGEEGPAELTWAPETPPEEIEPTELIISPEEPITPEEIIIAEPAATGIPNTDLAFFMSSESYLGGDKGTLNEDFDECPIQANDYGTTTEKCGNWQCTSRSQTAADIAIYCSGIWNCTKWNGVTCAQYGCTNWATTTNARKLYYCSGGFNCTKWNGNVCENWNCTTWLRSATADADVWCSGQWDCTNWVSGVCQNWNCTTWTTGANDKKDRYCSGIWNCTNWNGGICDKWNCTAWTAPSTTQLDVFCDGSWNCTAWNNNVCSAWNCTKTNSSATTQRDWYCPQWNCTTWDSAKRVCAKWNCISWASSTVAQTDSYCSGTWNCTTWKTFAPTVNLVSPADASTPTVDYANFTCNATSSAYPLANITFYWNYGGLWTASETKTVSGTSNQSVFAKTGLSGAIKWNCYACDNQSACGFAPANYTLYVSAYPPAIRNVNATPKPPIVNQVTNFSANITDDVNTSTAWFGHNFDLVHAISVSQTVSELGTFAFGKTVKVGQQLKFPSATNIYGGCVKLIYNNRPIKGNVIVSIYNVGGTGLPKTELSNFTIPASSITTTKQLFCGNFSKTITASANTVYALVVSSPASTSTATYKTYLAKYNAYTGGSFLKYGTAWKADTRKDLYFIANGGNFQWKNETFITINAQSAIVSLTKTIKYATDVPRSYMWCANDTEGNVNCKNFNYPIYSEAINDVIYPIGSIIAPPNASTINGLVTLIGNASDDFDVEYASIQYMNSTVSWTDFNNCDQIIEPYECIWNTSLFSNASEGYDVRILPCDSSGNCNTTTPVNHYTISFGLAEATYSVIYPGSQTSIRNGQTLTIKVNATDNDGINMSIADLTLLNGTGNTTMALEAGSQAANELSIWNISVVLSGTTTGIKYIPVYVYDTAAPTNNVATISVPVMIDNSAPAYNISDYGYTPSDPIFNDTEVTFSVSVTDNYNLSYYIFSSNFTGSWTNTSAIYFTQPLSDVANYSPTLYTGFYEYYFLLYDDAGNVNKTETRNITINPPEPPPINITLISPDDGAAISYPATVDLNYSYTGPTANACSLYLNVVLNQTVYVPANETTLTFSISPAKGDYSWYVSCNNSYGTDYDSDARSFSIVNDTTPPTISDTTTVPALPLDYNGTAQTLTVNFTSSEYPLNLTFEVYNSTGYIVNTTIISVNSASELPVNYTLPSGLADGTYAINMTATDSDGNPTTTTLGSITVDTSAPTITSPSTVPALPLDYNGTSQDIAVNFTSDEYPLNLTFNVYNSTGNIVSTTTITVNSSSELPITYALPGGLPEGDYSVNMTAVDTAGNPTTVTLGTITVDNTAPTITSPVSVPSLPLIYNGTSQNLSINFTSSEFAINVTFSLAYPNGTIAYTAGPTTIANSGELPIIFTLPSGLTDGSYTLNMTTTDMSGNSNTTTLGTVTVDTVAPTLSGATSSPSLPIFNDGTAQDISVGFSSSEYPINATFNLYYPNGTIAISQIILVNNSGELPINFTMPSGLPDFVYTLNLSISDSAGNADTTTLGTITVDTAPPSITSPYTIPALPLDYNGTPQNIAVGFNSDDYPLNLTFNVYNSTGDLVSTTNITLNSSSELPITYTLPGGLPEGDYSVNMTAADSLGHPTTVTLGTITVDNTAPTITNPTSVPALPVTYDGTPQNLAINFTSDEYPLSLTFVVYNSTGDPVSTIIITVNDSSALPVTYTIPSSLTDGNYTLNMTAADSAGNPAATISLGTIVANIIVPPTTLQPGGGGGGGGMAPPLNASPGFIYPLPEEAGTSTISLIDNIDLISITLKTTGTLLDASIKIYELSSNPPETPALMNVIYKYWQIITTNVPENAPISYVNINFRVRKSWAESNNIDINSLKLNRYSNGAWQELPTTLTRQDATYYYFTGESLGFSVFGANATVKSTATPQVPITPPVTPPIKQVQANMPEILFLLASLLVFIHMMRHRYRKETCDFIKNLKRKMKIIQPEWPSH